jgi:hypothetical protein
MVAEVTITMTPRERYSGVEASIVSYYEHTKDTPFEMIVVDGAMPAPVREFVERESKARGFRFEHRDYPLCSNEARRIALELATTPYVILTDNDALVHDGWLKPLLTTANDMGAQAVCPTILDGVGTVHAAGGRHWIDEERHYHFEPAHMDAPFDELKDSFKRCECNVMEEHVVLADREFLIDNDVIDPNVKGYADNDDFSFGMANAGGKMVYEPQSIVTFHDIRTNPNVIKKIDLPYFLMKWSDEWNEPTIEHLAKKWGLDPNDSWMSHGLRWCRIRRRSGYRADGLYGRLTTNMLYHVSASVGDKMEKNLHRRYTAENFKLREQALGTRAIVPRKQ